MSWAIRKYLLAAGAATMLSSQAVAAAPAATHASVDPLVMLSALGTTQSRAAVCAAGGGAPKALVKKKNKGRKPKDASAHPLVKRLREKFGDALTGASTFVNQLSINVKAGSIVEICRHLRDDPQTRFDYLSDLTCVHWPEREDAPFEVVYNLFSISKNERVRLKVAVSEEVGSVTGGWPSTSRAISVR